MKVILLMTLSTDGYSARLNDDAPWSAEEFARCNAFVANAGNIIVGRRTYEIMKEAGDCNDQIETVVLSHAEHPDSGKVHFVTTPTEAMEYLASKGVQAAVVGGGATINAAFLDEELLDEIVLDIEPVVLGEGLTLFSKHLRNVRLDLLDMEKLDANSVRLHYRVIK